MFAPGELPIRPSGAFHLRFARHRPHLRPNGFSALKRKTEDSIRRTTTAFCGDRLRMRRRAGCDERGAGGCSERCRSSNIPKNAQVSISVGARSSAGGGTGAYMRGRADLVSPLRHVGGARDSRRVSPYASYSIMRASLSPPPLQ